MEIIILLSRHIITYVFGAIFFHKYFSHTQKPRYNNIVTIVLLTGILCSIRALWEIFFPNINGIYYTMVYYIIWPVAGSCLYLSDVRWILVWKGILICFFEWICENIFAIIMFPWLNVNLYMSDNRADIAKIVYVSILYMGFTIYDILSLKRREKLMKYIVILNFAIGIIQILTVRWCVVRNFFISQKYIIPILITFNLILLVEYVLTTEVFGELLEQQKRTSELEKIKIERKYQYDYYQLVQKQGEEIRNIRHDLRNQLQTIQYMLEYGDEEGEKVGREMFEMLKKKVNHLE